MAAALFFMPHHLISKEASFFLGAEFLLRTPYEYLQKHFALLLHFLMLQCPTCQQLPAILTNMVPFLLLYLPHSSSTR